MDITYYKKYEPIFGEWRIVREIGEGSFGKVFEIERTDFGRTYKAALKAITVPQSQSELKNAKLEFGDDESVTSYFHGFVKETVEEFALMSKLKGGNNIVSYEDHKVFEHENGIGWDILIRMELLTPLVDYIQSSTLTRSEIIKLGTDMCRALERCSKLNIIHRDIKPENIFVSEFGDFKLGDFGVARISEKTLGGMSKKGTYNYMAPEVYKGEDYGASVDIYSLGLVLYKLLNGGRTPFLPLPPMLIKSSERDAAIMRRIRGEALTAPAYADKTLAVVILKACAYKSEDRYKSPTEMRLALEALATSGEAIPTVTEIHSAMAADGATVSMLGGNAAKSYSSSEPADRDGEKVNQTVGLFSKGSATKKNIESAYCVSDTALENRIEMPDEEDTEATLKECTKGGYGKEQSKQQNASDVTAAAALTKKDKPSLMLFFKEHKSVAGVLACVIICVAMLAVVLSHGNTDNDADPVIIPLVTAEPTEEVNNNEAEPEETEDVSDKSIDILFDPNGGTLTEGQEKKTVSSASPCGTLPEPKRDYCTFEGWYSSAEGGEKLTKDTVISASGEVKYYAHWINNPVSGWVLASDIPESAQVINNKWTYTKTTTKESKDTSLNGYSQISSKWVQSNSGSFEYSPYFSSNAPGFYTGHPIYSMSKSPYSSYENDTSKRDVFNSWAGYIYWHWMYDCGGAGANDRAIYYQMGNGSNASTGNNFYYQYFGAFKSSKNYNATTQNWNQGSGSYRWYEIYDRSSYGDTQGTYYWYRFDYYICSYTDYYKLFTYQKVEKLESSTEIAVSNTISNVQHWVQYRAK